MSCVWGRPGLGSVTEPGSRSVGRALHTAAEKCCCGSPLGLLWAGPGLSGFLCMSSCHPLCEGCAWTCLTSRMAKLNPGDVEQLFPIHALSASCRVGPSLGPLWDPEQWDSRDSVTTGGFLNTETPKYLLGTLHPPIVYVFRGIPRIFPCAPLFRRANSPLAL